MKVYVVEHIPDFPEESLSVLAVFDTERGAKDFASAYYNIAVTELEINTPNPEPMERVNMYFRSDSQ